MAGGVLFFAPILATRLPRASSGHSSLLLSQICPFVFSHFHDAHPTTLFFSCFWIVAGGGIPLESTSSLRQIARANQNGPIQFCVAGKISPPYLLLDGLAIRPEYFKFVFTVSMEMSVKSFPSD